MYPGYVANNCNIDEAPPVNVDRGDNPLDGGEVDEEGDSKEAPVSRRKRKRRGSTTTAPVVEIETPVQHVETVPAALPDPTVDSEGDALPPLTDESSGDTRIGAMDEVSETSGSDEEPTTSINSVVEQAHHID